MNIIKSKLKKYCLVSALLSSSCFYSSNLFAVLKNLDAGANGQTSSNASYLPTNGYNFTAANVSFSITASNNIGKTGAISVDNNNGGGALTGDVLTFLGSSTVSGTIGPTNPIGTINLKGAGGTTVTLGGNTNIGSGNLNFVTGAAAGTILSNSVTLTITGNIDNTTGADGIGTLTFPHNATVTGTIGATHALAAINLTSNTYNFNNNINLGTGNINFSGNNGVMNISGNITGNISTVAAPLNVGIVNFLTNSTVTGTVAAANERIGMNLKNPGIVVNFESPIWVNINNLNFSNLATANTTINLSDGANVSAGGSSGVGNIDNTTGNPNVGTLNFLGNSTVVGSIGSSNSLYTLTLNAANTTVVLDSTVNVGTGNINFINSSNANTTLDLLSSNIFNTNIDNLVADGVGSLIFDGGLSYTINGTIGATHSLYLINFTTANGTLSLTQNVNVGAGNLNFSGSANSSSLIRISDGVTITSNIDNTTGSNNNGIVIFLGSSTVTGTIGATNSLSQIDLTGGAGTAVNLQGNVTVGTGNLNFNAGAAATSTLNLSNNVTVTGNIDNFTGSSDNGTLTFLGNGTVTGTIGASDSLNAINLTGGAGTTVNLQGNVKVGAGNLNFATGTAATSTLSLSDSVTVTGNINNTTGSNNFGTLLFLGNGTVTGKIGATNSLSAINLTGGAGTTVNLQGNVTVGTGNLNFATGTAATSTLSLSDGVTVTGNINNTTGSNNFGTLLFLGNGTVTGKIGATNSLSTINITGNTGATVNLQSNIKVGTGNLNFATGADSTSTLTLANNVTVTGNIDNTTGSNNNGILTFLGNGTVTGTIGATKTLSAINLTGGAGTTVNLLGNIMVGTGNLNFASGSSPSTALNIANGITVTGNIDNTSTVPDTGTLNFAGNATVTGTIGATLSLFAINIQGVAGTVVNLQNNTTVSNGNINFTAGATTATLSLSNKVTVNASIDNTSGTAGEGTIVFLGGGTITGSIGTITNSIYAINLTGGVSAAVNLQSNVTVGAGNINFATGSTSSSMLNLSNNVTVTGNINNTTGFDNKGILTFLGNGTVTGTIGGTNTLSAINLTGGAGTAVNLQGNVTVGTGNLNFALGSAPSSVLNIANGVTVTGNIDNTSTVPDTGTLNFTGNATVTGTIGATLSLFAINIQGGAGTVVNLQNNTTVSNGNINFATGAAATSTLSFSNNAIVAGNIDNTTGKNSIGTVSFVGSGQVIGNIGVNNSINLLTINASGGANQSVELDGTTLNIDTININDDGSGISAQGSQLILNNTTGPLTLGGNISATTNNEDSINIKGTSLATINGSIGTNTIKLNMIQVGASAPIIFNQNVYANNIQINGNNTVTFGVNGNTTSGTITTTMPNQGSIIFDGSFSANGAIGTNPDRLNTITLHGNAMSSVNFNDYPVFTAQMNVDNEGTLAVSGNQTIDGALNVTNASSISLAMSSALTIGNTLGAGTLNLDAGTMLVINMGNNLTTTGNITTQGLATVSKDAVLVIYNPPSNNGTNATLPLIVSNGGGAALNPIKISSPSMFTNFKTVVNGNQLDLLVTFSSFSSAASQTNTIGVAYALEALDLATTTGSLAALLQQISSFTNDDDFNADLATLAPTVDGAVMQQSFSIQHKILKMINQGLDRPYFGLQSASGQNSGDNQWGNYSSWISIFGQHAHQQVKHEIAGYKDNTWGILIGHDFEISDNAIVGAAVSWASTDVINFISIDSKTQINAYQGTLYGQYQFTQPLYINGSVAAAYNNYHAARNIIFGKVRLTPKSNYHGTEYGAQAEMGYVLTENNIHTIPLISLYYSHLDLNSYTEKNAGTASQSVNAASYNMLLAGLGAKFTFEYDLALVLLQPEMHFNVFYDFYGDTMQTTSQFTGGGPDFFTAGVKPAQTSYNIGGTITNYMKCFNLKVILSADLEAREQYTGSAGYIRFEYDF